MNELQGLLLRPVRLSILEWEPACALVEVVMLGDHGRVSGEHDAVQTEPSKYRASKASK